MILPLLLLILAGWITPSLPMILSPAVSECQAHPCMLICTRVDRARAVLGSVIYSTPLVVLHRE